MNQYFQRAFFAVIAQTVKKAVVGIKLEEKKKITMKTAMQIYRYKDWITLLTWEKLQF